MSQIVIGGKTIGGDAPCFIIAEAGVNHNGDMALARKLIDVAVDAGADAVKFQTFKVDMLTSPNTPKATYQVGTTGSDESQDDMLRKLELSYEDFRALEAYCQERGIAFISTPFDHDSVDFLGSLGVPAFKVPSGETTNLPLLAHIARMGKPVILSTGMSYLSEVERAIRTMNDAGNHEIAVLHCVSNYPTAPEDVNLRAMHTIASAFGVPVGFSDHTMGVEIPIAAVALGAKVIEKHFTLDRNMPGPDHRASLEPDELAQLVRDVRAVEKAIGDGIKRPKPCEMDTRAVARRSICLRNGLQPGETIAEQDLIALRPAGGIPPDQYDLVVGRRLRHAVSPHIALKWEDID
jgi:N-acetylneuraminate synthase/N,N'-diacetyllegionaminate synthase